MATKKRGKPSKKPTTKRKGKGKQILTPIEKELLECARKGLPVLLGKNVSKDSILKVHKIIGGGFFRVKDCKINDNFVDIEGFIHLDCKFSSDKPILIKDIGKIIKSLFFLDEYLEMEKIKMRAGSLFREPENRRQYANMVATLFIDDLRSFDDDLLNKLIDMVNRAKYESPIPFIIIHSPMLLPDWFKEKFKEITFDSKVVETIEIDDDHKLLKYRGKEAKVEPKQIELFELLWKNKDEIVRRKEIDKELWPVTDSQEPTSPIQIEQQVNKLRDGLEGIGFKREIIETIKKTQINEGGYKFHSNLTSFLK